VSGINLNDKEIGKTWVSHAELLNGCTLDFNMVPAPVQSPGGKDAVPFSFSSVQNK
jgi:putative alpha-1,2-mannosidase